MAGAHNGRDNLFEIIPDEIYPSIRRVRRLSIFVAAGRRDEKFARQLINVPLSL